MITPDQLASSGTEDGHQLALFCWIALDGLKLYPDLKWLHHIPNGGSRDKREAAKLKGMGVKSGVPDLCLPIKRGAYSGLYIELKKPMKGKVSPQQSEWITHLQSQGFGAIVCHGWLVARETLISYLDWEG